MHHKKQNELLHAGFFSSADAAYSLLEMTMTSGLAFSMDRSKASWMSAVVLPRLSLSMEHTSLPEEEEEEEQIAGHAGPFCLL